MSEAPSEFTPENYVDDQGRAFTYVHIRHGDDRPLAIHFSAFFGKWGDAKPYRAQFQGYFHRLRMLGSHDQWNWLFLCDAYGAFENGTYYTGEAGDFFVERAMLRIIDDVMVSCGYERNATVTVGSSMGATGAIKFALLRDLAGIVAICPHIDLDTSAAMQNRRAEVAFICPDGDATSVANHVWTRQIRHLVQDRSPDRPLPRLFVQSCADDVGVHEEQVLPLCDAWRGHNGVVDLDVRPHGGHTSDYATRPLLLDAIDCIRHDRPIDVHRYATDPAFVGTPIRPPWQHRARRALSLARRRVLGSR
jgi:hypothetical protein